MFFIVFFFFFFFLHTDIVAAVLRLVTDDNIIGVVAIAGVTHGGSNTSSCWLFGWLVVGVLWCHSNLVIFFYAFLFPPFHFMCSCAFYYAKWQTTRQSKDVRLNICFPFFFFLFALSKSFSIRAVYLLMLLYFGVVAAVVTFKSCTFLYKYKHGMNIFVAWLKTDKTWQL